MNPLISRAGADCRTRILGPIAAMIPESTESRESNDEKTHVDLDLYCVRCGYNLRGLPVGGCTCPECGRLNRLDGSGADRNMIKVL